MNLSIIFSSSRYTFCNTILNGTEKVRNIETQRVLNLYFYL